MFKEQLKRLPPLARPFVLLIENGWRQSSPKSRMLRSALLISMWLVMVGTFIYFSLNYRIGRPTEANIHDQTNQQPTTQGQGVVLPRKIWQIYLTPPNVDKSVFKIDPVQLSDAASWLAHNPDYEYVMVGDKGAEELILQHFKNNSTLLRIFRELRNTGIKSDLLRYMILSIKGGVYSDIDTENLKPIDVWVPEKYRNDTQVAIGVEFDRLDGPNWGEVHPDLQFCQWTIAAFPGHNLFSHMVEWVASKLEAFAMAQGTTFANLNVTASEVMELTGPAAWTDAVFWQLQQFEPTLTSLRNLSGLTEPRLVGDILILPIDGFGMGQPHSNSTNDGSVPGDALW
ncbi:hypothetical protein ETB97_006786 [Aspergillus alliaceus]|uniref:Initiation-specific alpha-1,6-mannosyltransferase n=1 Tax=Petromyces alliaceus TaxID=209559 RepID=A0A8H5ZTU6_PETAA|nr:hypothetical protein ETB97_006786 [Aspergillus burnettii]